MFGNRAPRIALATALILAGSWPAPGVRAGEAPARRPDRRNQFHVPGVYEPRDHRLVWRAGFWAVIQPGWRWVPAGWVRLREGWGFQPGQWTKAAPGQAPNASGRGGRPVTVIMPGPGLPEIRDAGPSIERGDPEQFAGRVVGPILSPVVVNSQERMEELVVGPIDWADIAARRARLTTLLGVPPLRYPGVSAPGTIAPSGGAGPGQPMSPSFYIGNSLPGTTYPSYALTPAGIPGQSTYIGNSLPGTSYPSYSFSPSPVPGQSFYIGNSLPGTSYPSYSAGTAGSVNNYGYGTAPPGNTAGQSPTR